MFVTRAGRLHLCLCSGGVLITYCLITRHLHGTLTLFVFARTPFLELDYDIQYICTPHPLKPSPPPQLFRHRRSITETIQSILSISSIVLSLAVLAPWASLPYRPRTKPRKEQKLNQTKQYQIRSNMCRTSAT